MQQLEMTQGRHRVLTDGACISMTGSRGSHLATAPALPRGAAAVKPGLWLRPTLAAVNA